ncbi:hypothetical protein H9623_17965 [Oerskovia sp. Sa1BUA8]|uniref:RepA protein n=1 Tax=Oerskovia douganii TaxID=2762210 RepID=A0A9D5UC30_9CELL|nr:replication protein RepA [Oerskovia douganii]MBE7702180.1 hypothetical protein [Oerskovia douganii]
MSERQTKSDGAKVELVITPKQKRLLDDALAIEREDALSAGTVGFQARIWAQLALPYRDPGDVSRWERRNGNEVLIVRPAALINPDGSTRDGYPFGVIPRYLMTWMATEAVRTQSPRLDMGGSLNEFLAKVGMGRSGADGRRLKEQVHRLVGSTMQHQRFDRYDAGQWVQGENFNVASSFELWLPDRDGNDPGQGALWNNTITLSEPFFESIVTAPVPVDLRAMKALQGSPMRLDIYTWLTYRMSYLKGQTLIPWELLELQFGGQYSRTRKFKEAFVGHLAEVTTLYPAARVVIEDKGLKLLPSAPHVARRAARELDK